MSHKPIQNPASETI